MTVDEARAILGLRNAYLGDDLLAAYRASAMRTHPDRGGDAASFGRVVEAYELLKREQPGATEAMRRGSTGFRVVALGDYASIWPALLELRDVEVEHSYHGGYLGIVRVPRGTRLPTTHVHDLFGRGRMDDVVRRTLFVFPGRVGHWHEDSHYYDAVMRSLPT